MSVGWYLQKLGSVVWVGSAARGSARRSGLPPVSERAGPGGRAAAPRPLRARTGRLVLAAAPALNRRGRPGSRAGFCS